MAATKNKLPKKYILVIVGIILGIILIFGANAFYENWIVKYDELNTNYQILEKKYQKASKEDKIIEVNSEIYDLDAKKTELQKEIDDLNVKKDKLNSEIISLKGQPISFPAGNFIAGKDFDVGRYKIYDGSSNFTVRNAYDRLQVNIILGSNTEYHRITEYIYEFQNGDKIEANSSFKLVLVD